MKNNVELPSGWTTTTIGAVTEDQVEQLSPSGDGVFTYIDIGAIDRYAKIISDPKVLSIAEAPSRARQRVAAGDVLVSMTRPNLNAVALVPPAYDGATATTGFHVLRARGVAPRWIYYLVQSARFVQEMSGRVQGVVYPAVRPGDIRSFAIPLAPRREQELISDALDTGFSRLTSAMSGLERVRSNLKAYCASVLKAASEGRLVPTEVELARQEARGYESADVLLARTLAQRRARWEAEEIGKLKARGKDPSDNSWKERYQDPEGPDTGALPELPKGWIWSSIGELFRVYVGSTPRRSEPAYWGGTIPWTSSGEVNFSRIRSTAEHITDAGLRNASTELHPPGTVLLAMIGEGRTRGQAAILEIAACHNQNSAAIRVSETECLPEFVYYYFRARYDETRRVGAGNNQPALSKTRVAALPFPLPPLKEQQRIVAEVERRLSVADAVETQVRAQEARINSLRNSILRRAFEGRLVSSFHDDGDAGVALEKTSRDREAAAASLSSTSQVPSGASRD